MVKDGWRRNNQVNAPPLPVHLSSYLSPPFRVLDLHHHLLHPNIRDPRRCHQKHRPNPLPLHLFDDRLHVDGTAVWRKFSQVVYPRPFLLAVTLHVYADELCFRGVKGSQFVIYASRSQPEASDLVYLIRLEYLMISLQTHGHSA
jgi:hypothetical protein